MRVGPKSGRRAISTADDTQISVGVLPTKHPISEPGDSVAWLDDDPIVPPSAPSITEKRVIHNEPEFLAGARARNSNFAQAETQTGSFSLEDEMLFLRSEINDLDSVIFSQAQSNVELESSLLESQGAQRAEQDKKVQKGEEEAKGAEVKLKEHRTYYSRRRHEAFSSYEAAVSEFLEAASASALNQYERRKTMLLQDQNKLSEQCSSLRDLEELVNDQDHVLLEGARRVSSSEAIAATVNRANSVSQKLNVALRLATAAHFRARDQTVARIGSVLEDAASAALADRRVDRLRSLECDANTRRDRLRECLQASCDRSAEFQKQQRLKRQQDGEEAKVKWQAQVHRMSAEMSQRTQVLTQSVEATLREFHQAVQQSAKSKLEILSTRQSQLLASDNEATSAKVQELKTLQATKRSTMQLLHTDEQRAARAALDREFRLTIESIDVTLLSDTGGAIQADLIKLRQRLKATSLQGTHNHHGNDRIAELAARCDGARAQLCSQEDLLLKSRCQLVEQVEKLESCALHFQDHFFDQRNEILRHSQAVAVRTAQWEKEHRTMLSDFSLSSCVSQDEVSVQSPIAILVGQVSSCLTNLACGVRRCLAELSTSRSKRHAVEVAHDQFFCDSSASMSTISDLTTKLWTSLSSVLEMDQRLRAKETALAEEKAEMNAERTFLNREEDHFSCQCERLRLVSSSIADETTNFSKEKDTALQLLRRNEEKVTDLQNQLQVLVRKQALLRSQQDQLIEEKQTLERTRASLLVSSRAVVPGVVRPSHTVSKRAGFAPSTASSSIHPNTTSSSLSEPVAQRRPHFAHVESSSYEADISASRQTQRHEAY